LFFSGILYTDVTYFAAIASVDWNMSSTRNELAVNASRVIVGKATESDPCRVGCVDNPNARILRVVHISDTRSNNESLVIPAGDILIHSGSFFNHDSCKDFSRNVAELDDFFASQSHKYKVVTSHFFASLSNLFSLLLIVASETSRLSRDVNKSCVTLVTNSYHSPPIAFLNWIYV